MADGNYRLDAEMRVTLTHMVILDFVNDDTVPNESLKIKKQRQHAVRLMRDIIQLRGSLQGNNPVVDPSKGKIKQLWGNSAYKNGTN